MVAQLILEITLIHLLLCQTSATQQDSSLWPGSDPSVYLPKCLHNGKRDWSGGKLACICTDTSKFNGPLCEANRVTIANKYDDFLIKLDSAKSTSKSTIARVSFSFVSNLYEGTGKLIAFRNNRPDSEAIEFSISLLSGVVSLEVESFKSNISSRSLTDNTWHTVDLTFVKQAQKLDLLVVVDAFSASERESRRIPLQNSFDKATISVGESVLIGENGSSLEITCLENLYVNEQL
ncbi:hypothetical protein Ciccas_012708, partial [Cichlidogyrus casuarinus]